ncbi:MAG: 8-amino-7-oxononanoate synthase [Thermodesulfobacteriota bacterium]
MKRIIEEELKKITAAGLKRSPRILEGPVGTRVRIDGEEKILLCSNDYLGLANNPEVKKAFIEGVERYGAGAGASRLVSGTLTPHKKLEERIRDFKGTESALIFNSGYNANVGLITTLADRSTEIFSDRLNHASIVDACVLSRAKVKRYAHGDVDSLEGLLKKSTVKKKIIITEGVFSMDGDVAPLGEITGLLERYGAQLILDDAHGVGVLGEKGRGTLEHFSIKDHPLIIQMGTFGKAFGAFGAFVAGSRELIELLISKARTFIYTTALPPAICEATIKAIGIVDKNPALVKGLNEKARYMREGLKEAGIDILQSTTQIIPLLVGEADRAMEISKILFEKGLFVQGIRPPTVPENTSRLRLTATAAHTKDDLDFALSTVKDTFFSQGVFSG